MRLELDSLGLFLTRGGGKRQMSDKFQRLRGVLIISPVPRCVMSCSVTGSVRRRDETETSIPLRVPCVCVPTLLLNGVCKVIFLMIVIAEEVETQERTIMDQTRPAFQPPEGCMC